ncbi:hypothetical protein PC114_g5868 [Phytophthora cactorum]|nr:hypothetical protein PC114_g5868 [Phytophthora cactorum]
MVKRYFELLEFIDVEDDDIMELLPPRRQTSDCAFCTKNYATSSPCRKRCKSRRRLARRPIVVRRADQCQTSLCTLHW